MASTFRDKFAERFSPRENGSPAAPGEASSYQVFAMADRARRDRHVTSAPAMCKGILFSEVCRRSAT
jgi:hypothetical protein